jgi:hypothetical protein
MRAKVRFARGDWPSAEPAALDGQVDINTRILKLPSLSLPIRSCHLRQKYSTLRTELDTNVYTGTVGNSLWPALVQLSFGVIPPLVPGSPGSGPPPDATPAERCQGDLEQARSSLLLLICSSLAESASAASNVVSFPHFPHLVSFPAETRRSAAQSQSPRDEDWSSTVGPGPGI